MDQQPRELGRRPPLRWHELVLGLTPAAEKVVSTGNHYGAMVTARSVAIMEPPRQAGGSQKFRALKAPQGKQIGWRIKEAAGTLRAAIPSREEELLKGWKHYLLDRLPLELTLLGPAFPGKSRYTG